VSVLLGHAADAGLMLRAAIRESQWRSGMTWRVPLGWVLTDGLSDGLRCAAGVRWWGSGEGWRGPVWCASGLSAGISGCSGLLWVGWRAARLSRSCHKWCETWWDAGGYVETISAGRREGRDGLGRVNIASR